jgi:hypothetical protein
MTTVFTSGDSILDCGRYNDRGVHPGGLIVRSDDGLFSGFQVRDLASRGPARLEHRAANVSIVHDLPGQARRLVLKDEVRP